jgi:hypothetical protein
MVAVGLATVLMASMASSENRALAEVVGEVAASLMARSIDDPSGPAAVGEVARGWNNLVLSKEAQTPADVTPTFQRWQDANYDAVGYMFTISRQAIIVKQTIFVMVVSLPGQDTNAKIGEEAAGVLNTLAERYLSGFEHRHFVPSGEFNGTRVFRLAIDDGYMARDWRDKIIGTIAGNVVTFVFPKEKGGGAAHVLEDPEHNVSWFELSKKTR